VDELLDQADVFDRAAHDHRVAAFVGEDGDEFGKFVGGDAGLGGDGGGGVVGVGAVGGRNLRGLIGVVAAAAAVVARGGLILAGDELADEGGDFGGVGVFEGNDFVARVGVGAHVEFGDQPIEERMQARVAEDDQLIGGVVGVEGRAGAELLLGGAL